MDDQTREQFGRFCKRNWWLTSVVHPWTNAWRDFCDYKNRGLLDLETGTILNEDGSPAPMPKQVFVVF